jgi:hypothetical protein
MFGHSPIATSPFGALGDSTPIIVLSGIAPTSVIGDLTTAYHLTAISVAEADGFGDLTTGYLATLVGVADLDGLGALTVTSHMLASGVAEADGFGDLTTSYTVAPIGVVNPTLEIGRIGDLSTAIAISAISLVSWPVPSQRFGLADVVPGTVVLLGVGEDELAPILSAVAGTPTVFYVIRGLSMGSDVGIGSMGVTGDQTLSFSGAKRGGISFPGIAEIVETPGFRAFENGESGVLPFGGIVAWKASTGTTVTRSLAEKLTATNVFDIAGVVAGVNTEGENVPPGGFGFLYTRGMTQVLVIGHASLTAGSVVEGTAGQYHLQYASSQAAVNQFVIHEDHTSVGAVALKMVNVKVAI